MIDMLAGFHSWNIQFVLITSNFSFSHNFSTGTHQIIVTHLSIFLTSYSYLLLNWKSPKMAYQVKDDHFITQSRLLMTLYKKPFGNIVGKEENVGK